MFKKLIEKMSISVLRLLILMVSLISSVAVAGQQCKAKGDCKIQVTFTGTFLAQTCDVNVNGEGSSGTVGLPTVSAQLLQKSDAETGSTQFPVSLKNCPANRTVEMRFTATDGQAWDQTTGNLMNKTDSNYSKDVQLRLRKVDDTQMVINGPNSFQEYKIPANNDEEITHYFIVSYFAKSNGAVSAGLVQARSTIDLTYK